MKENCKTCGGKGVIDIAQTWHELTLWCPKCEREKFEHASEVYIKKYGIDNSKSLISLGNEMDVQNKMED